MEWRCVGSLRGLEFPEISTKFAKKAVIPSLLRAQKNLIESNIYKMPSHGLCGPSDLSPVAGFMNVLGIKVVL